MRRHVMGSYKQSSERDKLHSGQFREEEAAVKMVIISDPECNSESPLLHDGPAVHGAVDYQGRQVNKSSSGGWRSASFIIGVEVAERFANVGISSNLISYLTGPLGQSTSTAAENVNLWLGTSLLLPFVGAFVADSFLGRYRTIVGASVVYALGLSLLTLSVMLPSLSNPHCQSTDVELTPCAPPKFQVVLFFISLYLVAVGLGGHKPCVQAFGADQFDGQDAEEIKAKSSFFNWWYFGICGGYTAAYLILNYIQDYVSWGLGFGIPSLFMIVALLVFLLGTKTYRYSVMEDEKGPFGIICRAFASAAQNWPTASSSIAIADEGHGTPPHMSSKQFKEAPGEVEEGKSILRLIPIWMTCLVYPLVLAQVSTFFTKQGGTMDRSIAPGLTLSPASLQSLIPISVLVLLPVYDRVFVPIARAFTGKPSGITMLQRIGIGLFLSVFSMTIAALVELQRLRTALYHGLIDLPNVTVPMKIWWLAPQYIMVGLADVFAMAGLQEFFYDQVPRELRSVGLSLSLGIFGVGFYLSSFLVSVIEGATGSRDGKDGWFADNLNRGHLDYFYWLIAGLSSLGFSGYLYLAKSYAYTN